MKVQKPWVVTETLTGSISLNKVSPSLCGVLCPCLLRVILRVAWSLCMHARLNIRTHGELQTGYLSHLVLGLPSHLQVCLRVMYR